MASASVGGVSDEIADYDWSFRGYSVKDLLDERVGFGRDVTGGLGGRVYYVTTLADGGPGSLRDALTRNEPLWIVFNVSGVIVLQSPIFVTSNKTIDGRGASITITGYGLKLRRVSNVIIAYIRFDSGASASDIDAIEIRESSKVWIHHCDFTNYPDGAIDIVDGSTDITISWNRFWNHNKVSLVGNDPNKVGDANIRVTYHHNYFFMTGQRHPRVRFGKVDAFNNYLYGWIMHGMAVTMYGQILSEANIFEALVDKRAIRTDPIGDPAPGYAVDIGSLFLNGAQAALNESDKVFKREEYYTAQVEPADETLKLKIMAQAGVPWLPIEPKIMIDAPGSTSTYMLKTEITGPLEAGKPITFYAVIPPYRSPSEEVIGCEWDFGDGYRTNRYNITVGGFAVQYAYTKSGTYNLTVTLIRKDGTKLIITKQITVTGGETVTQTTVTTPSPSPPPNQTATTTTPTQATSPVTYVSTLVVTSTITTAIPTTVTSTYTTAVPTTIISEKTTTTTHTVTASYTTTRVETTTIPAAATTTVVIPTTLTSILTTIEVSPTTVTSTATTTATQTVTEWTTTTIIAVILLAIGFAIGYLTKRR